MANYNTNLWTGSTDGIHLTGVFPPVGGQALTIGSDINFNSNYLAQGGIHSVTTAAELKTDSRKFLWGVLEQFHAAYTGGVNSALSTAQIAAGDTPAPTGSSGSGNGKVTKMTVAKSALSLVDEDTAKTTYTVVFNYAVAPPGSTNLEVEAE